MLTTEFVVFDTETTGIFDFKKPADDPSQPRLASIAMIVTDPHGSPLRSIKRYIRPDGWSMPQGPNSAGSVNGLTDEILLERGVPVGEVLDLYEGFIKDGYCVAAFNAQFDCKVMRSEFRRAGRDDLFERTSNTCIMRSCKPYQERGLFVRNGQFVKLSAACEFFGIANANAHDAMADAEAARAIMAIQIADGNLIPPQVHYARTDNGDRAKA